VPTSATYALARRGGRAGRELAVAIDLLAGTGPRQMWRRRRQERELARLWPGRAVDLGIWRDAASQLGVPIREPDAGVFEIGAGEAPVRIRMHVTPIDDEGTLRLALDKAETHRLLASAGVPVPDQVRFELADLGPARRALAGGGSWVVKPAGGTSSGQGATTGVRSDDDLRRAAVRATRSGGGLLIERRAPGDEYRLLFLDGLLLGAVRRLAPTVIGDGRSTIAELVEEENRRRLAAGGSAGIRIVTLDLDALLALQHAGLGPGSVPAEGREVAVKGSRSQGGARDAETVAPASLSEELVAEASRAAEALGLRLAGVDLVTPDTGRSLAAGGGAAIEVNGTPGLHYHYLVREPEGAARVAVPILERLLG
jgi:cyanophycin synthetase